MIALRDVRATHVTCVVAIALMAMLPGCTATGVAQPRPSAAPSIAPATSTAASQAAAGFTSGPTVTATVSVTPTPTGRPVVVPPERTASPTPAPSPNADCGRVALSPGLLGGDFLLTPPAPARSGAAVEVIAGVTSEAPLEGFMESRDFLADPPAWTGRWEGVVPVLNPSGVDGVRLDTGAPRSPCVVRVIVERTGQGAHGEGVGAGPIRLQFRDGTEVVVGPERCFWRGFSGPGLGSVTCHGARDPQWSRLLVWVRFSYRESEPTTPPPSSCTCASPTPAASSPPRGSPTPSSR